MSSLTGTPPTQNVGTTPAVHPPGYDFARQFFDSYLPQFVGQGLPGYKGNIDPGLSPTLANLLQTAQGYSQSQLPNIFGQAAGSLGQFMNPSFQNPYARMTYGGAPNYFPQNPNQTMWGGTRYGDLDRNAYDPRSPQGPNPSSWWSTNQGPSGVMTPNGPGQGPGQGAGPYPRGVRSMPGEPPPTMSPSDPFVAPGGLGIIPGVNNTLDANTLPTPQGYDANGVPIFAQRAQNAQYAWKLPTDGSYQGGNKGQMRRNPQTGQLEILMGSGQGGDTYSWQAFDPTNPGHAQNAAMFQRYGSGWTTGGGANLGGHSGDIAARLQAQLGRTPSWQEINDAMYGVTAAPKPLQTAAEAAGLTGPKATEWANPNAWNPTAPPQTSPQTPVDPVTFNPTGALTFPGGSSPAPPAPPAPPSGPAMPPSNPMIPTSRP